MGGALADYQFHRQYKKKIWQSPKHISLSLKYREFLPPPYSLSNLLQQLLSKNIKNIIGNGERKYIGYKR